MKFWELVSVFGRDGTTLREILGRPEWAEPWGGAFERFDDLVQRQKRDILDAFVPLELSQTLARADERTWSLAPDGHLRLGSVGKVGERILGTLEVHDTFGGRVLEEVLEFGSLNVGREGVAG